MHTTDLMIERDELINQAFRLSESIAFSQDGGSIRDMTHLSATTRPVCTAQVAARLARLTAPTLNGVAV